MKYVKFSKPSKDMKDIRKSFFSENKKFLKIAKKANTFYSKQKTRRHCKNCGSKISEKIFSQFHAHYTVCSKCSHFNGLYEDTNNFTNFLYKDSGGSGYYKFLLKNFDERVKKIYLPKVNFLKQVIKDKIIVNDIGSGAGHFLRALEKVNINGAGYEPSRQLVMLGKRKLKKNEIHFVEFNSIYNKILTDRRSNTLTLMGVLEHLQSPNKILEAFCKSSFKYLYFSVPLFSFSVFIENCFKNVYPRHLSEGHTHLYTEKSLRYLAKKFNLKIIGEWWFGSDFPDLFRSIVLESNTRNPKKYLQYLNHNFGSNIDEFQKILDKNKICSQVHMVLKK